MLPYDESNSSPLLKGKAIILRPPRASDKHERLAYGRDAEFRRMVGGDPRTLPPLTEAEVKVWYRQVASERFHWIIEAAMFCLSERLYALPSATQIFLC